MRNQDSGVWNPRSFSHYDVLETKVPVASRPRDRVGASQTKISRPLDTNLSASHTRVREPNTPPPLHNSLEFHSCLKGLDVSKTRHLGNIFIPALEQTHWSKATVSIPCKINFPSTAKCLVSWRGERSEPTAGVKENVSILRLCLMPLWMNVWAWSSNGEWEGQGILHMVGPWGSPGEFLNLKLVDSCA